VFRPLQSGFTVFPLSSGFPHLFTRLLRLWQNLVLWLPDPPTVSNLKVLAPWGHPKYLRIVSASTWRRVWLLSRYRFAKSAGSLGVYALFVSFRFFSTPGVCKQEPAAPRIFCVQSCALCVPLEKASQMSDTQINSVKHFLQWGLGEWTESIRRQHILLLKQVVWGIFTNRGLDHSQVGFVTSWGMYILVAVADV
jgi:hypothetical protein